MAEIVFDGVTKVFDEGTVAVNDLDLKVEDGALMILVGPSGCGKTTALRLVAGLEEITGGEIRIRGAGTLYLWLRPGHIAGHATKCLRDAGLKTATISPFCAARPFFGAMQRCSHTF